MIDLTPERAGYVRMLELIVNHSTCRLDRKEAKKELKALKNGATYRGDL